MFRLAPLLLLVGAAAPADERRFMVSGFDQLRVEGPFEVEVVTGPPSAVSHGDARTLDQVTVRVEGSTMVVTTGAMAWESRSSVNRTAPRVTVSVPSLRAVRITGAGWVRVGQMRGTRVDLTLNGTGSLVVGSIKTDDMAVNLTGSGNMTLAGTSARGRLRNTGSGSIEATGLTVADVNLFSQSSGTLSITGRYTARAISLGTGGISIAGRPECKITGPGPVACSGTIRQN